ncbi:MAG: chaperone modulatory protein CbpM [Pseudomonadales bacterium]|nr:chaperone modulatory protein CbpM [Pseudomonadales bacterium]
MSTQHSYEGVLLDDDTTFTLVEFCQLCDVPETIIVEMVQEGVMEPIGETPAAWSFHGNSLARARRAVRLMRDLDLNWAGAALVLDLLDQLDDRSMKAGLRRRP